MRRFSLLFILLLIALILLCVFLIPAMKNEGYKKILGTSYINVPDTGYSVGTSNVTYGNLDYNISDVKQCEYEMPRESLFCSDGSRKICTVYGCSDPGDFGNFTHPDKKTGRCKVGNKQCVRWCCNTGEISRTTKVYDPDTNTSMSASGYLA